MRYRVTRPTWLEAVLYFCFVITSFGILVAANSYYNAASVRIEQSGLDAARRDTGYVRNRLLTMLARIATLEQNALVVQHLHHHDLSDFASQLDGLRGQVAVAGPEFLQVAATDAAGNVQWSTLPMLDQKVNIFERDYFRKLSQGDADKIVSAPIGEKISGKTPIQFAYSVRDTTNTFFGAILISVDAELANKFQQSIPDDHQSVVTMLRSDRKILSRSIPPSQPTPELVSKTVPAMISKVVSEGSSTFRIASSVDGIPRFYSATHIPEWNTILLVGLETQLEDARLNRVKWQVLLTAAMSVMASLAITLAVVGFVRRRRTIARIEELGRDLGRRESVLLQIADNTTDLIALMDSKCRYIYVNAACQRTFGGDIRTWIGQRMGFSLDPRSDLNIALDTLAREGGSQRLLWDVPDSNGAIHWIDLEIVAVDIRADDFVSPCRYFAVGRDVTERVLAKQQVVVSQQRIENILRVGPGFFYELHIEPDGSSQVHMPVASIERLLGHAPEDATVDGLLMTQTHPDDVDKRRQAVRRCLAEGWASAEFRAIAKDGKLRWMLCQMQRSRCDDAGAEVIGFVTDITSEHAMRSRLRHSEQLASLGQLSASIAHEMNQPLAALSLAAENGITMMNLNRGTPERIKGKFEQIGVQVDRLCQLMNRVRQFGRNEHGSVSAFAVSTVVAEALTLAGGRIKSAGAKVELRLASDLPTLLTERLLLEQVLMNLIVNACDAYGDRADQTQRGAFPVTISAELAETGLTIRIADHAGGIAPDVLSRLFEPFVTTKAADLGTGLGLSICAANVAELGGEITAYNDNGGAVFEIHLPSALLA